MRPGGRATRRGRTGRNRPHARRAGAAALTSTLGSTMQILRHSKTSLTMDIHTEVPSEQTGAALKRLGEHRGSRDDSGEASA